MDGLKRFSTMVTAFLRRHHAWFFGLAAVGWIVWYWKGHPGSDPTSTLFSGLAFAGVVGAILLQRQELSLQRKELEKTREQVEAQRAALEGQERTMALQRHDTTFFQLVSLHHEIVRGITVLPYEIRNKQGTIRFVRAGAVPASGRSAFGSIYELLKVYFGNMPPGELDEHERALEAYKKVSALYQSELGHYFRNLYHIVKYVDRSGIPEGEKKGYTNLIRAQLSSLELVLLFYNCLSVRGREKFKPLVEKYEFLENIPFRKLFSRHHTSAWEAKAFGRRGPTDEDEAQDE